jgi:hypothetical protein
MSTSRNREDVRRRLEERYRRLEDARKKRPRRRNPRPLQRDRRRHAGRTRLDPAVHHGHSPDHHRIQLPQPAGLGSPIRGGTGLRVEAAPSPDDRFARCSDFARALAEQTQCAGAPNPHCAHHTGARQPNSGLYKPNCRRLPRRKRRHSFVT